VINLDNLRNIVGQTGHLQFVLLPPETYGTADSPGSKAVPAVGDPIDPTLPAQFDGSQFDPIGFHATEDPNDPSTRLLKFVFRGAGSAEFATWTGSHINDVFAIVMDGKVIETPYIKSEITGGVGAMGGLTADSARQLATILQYGQLPFPLVEISHTVASSVPTPPTQTQTAVAGTAAPSMSSTTPTAARTFLPYVVGTQDKSLSQIAAKLGLPLAQLETGNPQIKNYNVIWPGLLIYVPWQTWAPTPPFPTVAPSF
jgi:hypothetical protein